jgi:hypothetical protein
MKIAFIADLIDHVIRNGWCRYAYNLINGLVDRGEDVTLLYSDLPSDSIYKNIKKDEYRILGLPYIHDRIKNRLVNLKADNFDIFHDLTNYCMATGKSKAKKIVTLHDVEPLIYPEHCCASSISKFRYYIPRVLRNTEAVITDSNYQKERIHQYYGFPDEKIYTIYPGIDTSLFKKTENGEILENKYILYVGSLAYKKGITYLLRAFSNIMAKIPHNLVMIGSKGDKSGIIYEIIKELNFGKRVIIKQNCNDNELVNYYSHASLFVFPSLCEGFGFPPLEAMACGCPVITSLSTSLEEIFKDCAILVDPKNIDALKDSIINLLSDNALRNELVLKGYNRVKKLKWDNTVHATLEVYKKVNRN